MGPGKKFCCVTTRRRRIWFLSRLGRRFGPLAARAFGQDVNDEADQLLVAALRKFDRRQLWSDTVGLGRPPRARARASRPPLERGNQKTRVREPLESTTGDVAVDPLGGGHLVRRHGQRLRTGEEERLAELAITDRIKPMHHF